MIKNILTPVDGSKHSKKALEFACDLANKYGAKLHLLYVVQGAPVERTMVMGSAHVTFEANHDELKHMGQAVIDAATQIAKENGATITKATLESGPPAQHILGYANSNDIDMIIMGSRGLSDLAGLMMGSVSHKVTHLADCNCITVR